MTDERDGSAGDPGSAEDQHEPFEDLAAEFVAAATRFAEAARPWLTAAVIEHAAHPDGEPGTCRLCAVGDAVSGHWEDAATEVVGELGGFAERIMGDLRELIEQLLGTLATAFAAAFADYRAAVGATDPAAADRATAPAGAGQESDDPVAANPPEPGAAPSAPVADGAAPDAPRPRSASDRGFQRIEIRMEET